MPSKCPDEHLMPLPLTGGMGNCCCLQLQHEVAVYGTCIALPAPATDYKSCYPCLTTMIWVSALSPLVQMIFLTFKMMSFPSK
jgi:hypothetical protein